MNIKVKDSALAAAANEGMDAFIEVVVKGFKEYVGSDELTQEAMQALTPDQITLWDILFCATNSVTAVSYNLFTTVTAHSSSSTPLQRPCAYGD